MKGQASIIHFYQFLSEIRSYFHRQNFLDVVAPPLVHQPGIEPHIHPLQAYSTHENKVYPYYLQTSPEFMMKELLSIESRDMFALTFSFRDEPTSPIHRKQFLMLEWYRVNTGYLQIMEDCENLIRHMLIFLGRDTSAKPVEFKRRTIQEIFLEILQVDILQYLEQSSLLELIEGVYPEIPLPYQVSQRELRQSLLWEDLFFLLFLNKIEPHLKNYPALFLYEFPAPLAALSKIKESDTRVCERFELYLHGVEIGNCFHELTDSHEQERRSEEQLELKEKIYGYRMPKPHQLLNALSRGLPRSSGIAMGVERLYQQLMGVKDFFISHI